MEGEAGVYVEVPRDTGLQGWISSPDRLASYSPGPDESAATFRYIGSTFCKWAMPRKSPSNISENPSQAIWHTEINPNPRKSFIHKEVQRRISNSEKYSKMV